MKKSLIYLFKRNLKITNFHDYFKQKEIIKLGLH